MNKENTIEFTSQWGTKETVMFERNTYMDNGNLYIGVLSYDEEYDCFEPYGDLTVNLGVELKENLAYIDVNNCDHNLIIALLDKGLIIDMKSRRQSGFVTYPLFQISDELLAMCIE